MKRFLSVIVGGIIFSCSQNEFEVVVPCMAHPVPEDQQFPQAWRLMKITSAMTNSETTGEDMTWQELIELNADKTFTKARKTGNKTKKASGVFFFANDSIRYITKLTLIYSSGKELMNKDCTGQTSTETYWFRSTCFMLFTAGLACDRPSMEYERQVAVRQ